VGARESEAAQKRPKEAIITQVPAIIVEYHWMSAIQDEDSPPAKHVALFTIYKDTGFVADHTIDRHGSPDQYYTMTDSDIQKMLDQF
jgi:hypothetical protein